MDNILNYIVLISNKLSSNFSAHHRLATAALFVSYDTIFFFVIYDFLITLVIIII